MWVDQEKRPSEQGSEDSSIDELVGAAVALKQTPCPYTRDRWHWQCLLEFTVNDPLSILFLFIV